MSQRTCIEDGCERKFYGRGWCKSHYMQAYQRGRVTERPREFASPTASIDERLRHHGWRVTASGCWEWLGLVDRNGYGIVAAGVRRSKMTASRAAHLAWVGPLQDWQFACHHCDNPPCINPAHLYAGSVRDNSRDAVERQRTANGERQGHAKLTDVQVDEIRARYARGGITQKALATEYGVAQSLVSMVTRRKRRPYPTYRPI